MLKINFFFLLNLRLKELVSKTFSKKTNNKTNVENFNNISDDEILNQTNKNLDNSYPDDHFYSWLINIYKLKFV
jgi:hypothetical protein